MESRYKIFSFAEKIKSYKKIIIFFLFVVLSAVLWFLNSLNSEYSTSIDIPVEFKMPDNKANVSALPKYLKVNVKAFGYNILKYQLKKNFTPVLIDLNSIQYFRLSVYDTSKYYLLTYRLKSLIESNFSGNKLQIESIKPDTLYFDFSNFSQKKVKVIVDGDIRPKTQYVIAKNYEITPAYVTIKGPKKVVDSISYIKTEYLKLTGISENIKKTLKLQKIEGIEYDFYQVDVFITVEQYTELKINTKIKPVNFPDSIAIHLFPDNVTIVYKVGISNFKEAKESDFEVIVDYLSIDRMSTKIKTDVVSYPDFVYEFQQNPEFVDYIIEKK